MKFAHKRQAGASLVEVLVAILILSFGLLALGGMMTYAVQMPKLAGYRATAANLAAAHVERIKANPNAFANNQYASALNYDGTTTALSTARCNHPNCTETSLAAMDVADTNYAVRKELPAGGTITKCSPSPCTSASYGEMWVVWLEPSTFAALDPTNSDNCPAEVKGQFTPAPRCMYLRFKVQ